MWLHCRIQSCRHWKLSWLFSSRFMRRPANSPWRATSVNHRRRAGCSSARGRRRKWRIWRRPWSSTGSRASATHHASASQRAKTKVRCTTALFRIHCALHSWAHTECFFSVYRSEHVWWQLPVWCGGVGWWWVGSTVLHISVENDHHSLTNMQNRTKLTLTVLLHACCFPQMWTLPARSLLQCWAPPTQTPSSCQPRPCSHPRSHQASSVWSTSAPPSRTLRGRSPVWISLFRSPLNLSLPPAAGQGTSLDCLIHCFTGCHSYLSRKSHK